MNILSLDWELILNICKQLDNYIYCIRLLITCKQFYNNEILKKLIIDHFIEIKIDEYGTKRWYLNGKRHREDGPAIEYSDGRKLWYLNGKQISEYEFNKIEK